MGAGKHCSCCWLSPTHFVYLLERNKEEIVKEGAVSPLLNLSHSLDLKVQRNAAGALLNLTHIGQRSCWHTQLAVCT